MAPRLTPPCRQRGLSLVEMMIAMAIGLFIVAVASTLFVSQLRENRSLLLEARLMQDLRTTADLVARDLRRDGYWGDASAGVWTRGTVLALAANPYQAAASTSTASTASPAPASISLRYSRDAVENNLVDTNEQFGYRLDNGTLELLLGAGNWQALTDPASMTVTEFVVTATRQTIPLGASCAGVCVAGGLDCLPQQGLRSVTVRITARATADASVVRSLRSESRVRNDIVLGGCPKVA